MRETLSSASICFVLAEEFLLPSAKLRNTVAPQLLEKCHKSEFEKKPTNALWENIKLHITGQQPVNRGDCDTFFSL